MAIHSPSRGMTVQAPYTGVTAVTQFLDEAWPALFVRTLQRTPYQSPGWLRAWVHRLEPQGEPFVLTVLDAVGVQAALPLVRTPLPDGGTRIVPLSSPAAESTRLTGPGADEPAVAAAVGDYLKQLCCEGAHVHLPDVPASTALGRHLMTVWPQAAAVGYATVPVPWHKAALSRSTRRDHRRRMAAWMKLADDGHHVAFRRSNALPQVLDDYRDLARLHLLRCAARPPEDPSLVSQTGPVWPEVIGRCAGDVWTVTLSLDQQVVAAQLCLSQGQAAHSVLTAIHPDYQALAPGHVLLQMLLDDLATDQYEQLVLGRTVPAQRAYKQQYGSLWDRSLTFDSTDLPNLARVRQSAAGATAQ